MLVRAKDGTFVPAAAGPLVRGKDGSFRPAKIVTAPGPFVMTKAGALVPAKAAAPRPAPPAVPRMPDYAGARVMPAASGVPGALGAGRTLGEAVDAARLCEVMFPGDSLGAKGLRMTCEEYARGKNLATVCGSLPAALSRYQGDCERAVAGLVEGVAPRSAGDLLEAGRDATLDPRDREPLAAAGMLAKAVVGAIWPEVPAAYAAEVARSGPVAVPTVRDFVRRMGLPETGYFFGVLPSGRRIFFYADRNVYGIDVAELTRLSGTEVRDGDYVIEMRLACSPSTDIRQILTAARRGVAASIWTGGLECLPASTPLPVGAQPPPGPFESGAGWPDDGPQPDDGGPAQASAGGVFPLLAMVAAGLWVAAS